MERIRWMPATNGGPGTYIQFGPHDRKGYKGDFLTIRELRGGELRFDGYHRPEWPSNAGLTAVHERQGLHPRVHRHRRAQPGPLHAPHDRQLGAGRPRASGTSCASACGPPSARPGAWPEVVNMWELDGWDGLVANFDHELAGAGAQDPSLAEWWAVAASLRRGGVDRIVVPEPWTRPIDELVADGVRGERVRPRAGHRPARDLAAAAGRGPRPRASPPGPRWAASRSAPSGWRWAPTPRRSSCGRCPTGPPGAAAEQAWLAAADGRAARWPSTASAPRPRRHLAAHPPHRRPAGPAAHRPPARGVRPPAPRLAVASEASEPAATCVTRHEVPIGHCVRPEGRTSERAPATERARLLHAGRALRLAARPRRRGAPRPRQLGLGLGVHLRAVQREGRRRALGRGRARSASALGIATGATNHNTRHPLVTATFATTMHRLTGGRFALGLGRGFDPLFDAIGLPRITMRPARGLRRHPAPAVARRGGASATTARPARYPFLHQDAAFDEDIPVMLVALGEQTLELAGRGRRRRRAAHVLHRRGAGRAASPPSAGAPSRPGATRRRCASGRCWPPSATTSTRTCGCKKLVGRLGTYLQGYGDLLVRSNGWDPGCWRGSGPTRS